MLRNVAVAVADQVATFELGVLCEVFGTERPGTGLPRYDFAVCAVEPPPLRTTSGFRIDTPHRLDRLAEADLVAIPAWRLDQPPPEALLEALRDTVARGARVLSVCTGAFVLAAAGLLDGRRATTHWSHADELARRYPGVRVDPAVLYVDDGQVLTSAGTAAGIDLCLHVVRQEHGSAVANTLARRMVVPPHRAGGQAQYVEAPVPDARTGDRLDALLDWLPAHLDEPLAVDDLAARVLMSPRSFARRFRAITGTTPYAWLTEQRVLLAQRLLEETDDPIDVVAVRAGFGSAVALRQHFGRVRGTTPQAFRRTFRAHTPVVARG